MRLRLKRATLDDLEFLFELRNETSVRESSINPDPVKFEDHVKWFNQKINDLNAYLFVVIIDDIIKVGQTRVDVQENIGIISISTVKNYRGLGYGRLAIQQTALRVFDENQTIEEIHALIKLDNTASLKAFMKAGFCQDDIITINEQGYHKTILRKKDFLFEELDDMAYLPPFPQVWRIEPASACNFKCRHCPTGLDMNPDVGIMSMCTAEKIFEKLKHLPCRVLVLYHGGEPFLNPNLVEIAKLFRPIVGRIELNSNASILTDGVIDKILTANVIDRLSFSIDGTSSEENDKIRVNANFIKIAQNIKKLISAKNRLNLKRPQIFIANTQIPETQTITEKIGVPQFLLDTFKEEVNQISFKCTYALIWVGMPIKPGITKPNNNFCDHIINTITIRANGDVVPCCYDLITEMKMGNVLEQGLEEIWHGKKYVGLRKAIASFNPPKLCHGCEVLYPQAVMTKKDVKIT